ncbi:hypothetical protein C9374_004620 [Naegleria lovaniensis]|uniref:Glucose-methanol-choline oxidoreductase N-terminal domain-containing protein n=1 Tax=Naegleria lovaniensis TaxID=51637 RepID=A0AA88KKQ7_NAELO|nr:uncharacterized protein C9374_004620 [Naegleria lovaniensis]KAG2383283.1 hypothetical protein C9374_004620 [Naegleria lovaniensis]
MLLGMGFSFFKICSCWLAILCLLIASWLYSEHLFKDRLQAQHQRFSLGLDFEEFDYIVVGSGSAGSVLANRLSYSREELLLNNQSSSTVLLLEAGKSDNTPLAHFSFLYAFTFWSSLDWQYFTLDSESKINEGHILRKMYWPRGKILGGCSSTNAMIYMRGSPQDYDSWNECEWDGKSKIWNFENVLKYFKKSQRQMGDAQQFSNEYHGREGEWIVKSHNENEIVSVIKPIVKAFSKILSIPIIDDFNNPHHTHQETDAPYNEVHLGAVGNTQVNIYNGKRFSVVDAFLTEQVLRRENLFVRTQAHVTRILFNGTRAIGVEYFDERMKKYIVKKARKEVILSGGSINTPQLLMLSGIGDENQLKMHNISVIYNNPNVGRHLQDHVATYIPFYLTTSFESLISSILSNPFIEIFNLLFQKKGKLTTNGVELNTLLKTKKCEHDRVLRYSPSKWDLVHQKCYDNHHCDSHDIQIHGTPTVAYESGNFALHQHGYTFIPLLLQPKSRGTVSLKSSNPFDYPIIDSNFLGHEHDQNTLAEAVRLCLLVSEELRREKVILEPTIKVKKLIQNLNSSNSEEEKRHHLIRYALDNVDLIYHPTGTCRMSNSSEQGVVDERLRVFGVQNLRIVDASVMPSIVRGNTQAPVVMIAEIASDLILADNER